MSIEENNVPKRRSSAANRRRRRRGGATTTAPASSTTQQSTTASAETAQAASAPAEVVDRNQQRRESRKAAKAQSEKKGMQRVVDSERFSGIRGFYEDTMSEIRKVIWPDRTQTRNLTLVVIAMSTVMGMLLGGIDWILLKLFETIA